MGWPIPDIPSHYVVAKPLFWFWFMVLLLMLVVGTLFSLLIFNVTTYVQALLYGALPALLLWFCLFGIVLNRYEQSVAGSVSWDAETKQTKKHWQHWSRRQLAIVGNVLLSPEEHGMDDLLGDIADIPAYPEKARPLFGSPQTLSTLLNNIDQQLEQQHPHYRQFLQTIYVLAANNATGISIEKSVFEQWDLVSDSIDSIEDIQSLYDAENNNGLFLMLCFQHWSGGESRQYSELISAQLMASTVFARQHAMPVIAGLGRIMPLEAKKLGHDLEMLFEYNQLNKQKLQYVWLSGAVEKTPVEIMQYAEQHQWPLPVKKPLYSIDYSFGPAGGLIFPLSLAMLSEAARKTGKDQLIIYQTPQQTGTLCLISQELYS